MTSRAGMRTRTIVAGSEMTRGCEQCASVKRQRDQATVDIDATHRRLEYAAKSDGFVQPGQVRPTHERRQRARRDRPPVVQHQDVRRESHDILKIVSHENQRHVQRAAQAVDLALETPPDGTIDGSERLVEQQHRRLARQCSGERDALPLAAGQFAWSFRPVSPKVHRIQQLRCPRPPLRSPDDARVLS